MSFFKSPFASNNASTHSINTNHNNNNNSNNNTHLSSGNSTTSINDIRNNYNNNSNGSNDVVSLTPSKKSLTYILNSNNHLESVNEMKGHHCIGVNSLIYNKSEKSLISGGRDGQISIWKFNNDNSNENFNSSEIFDNKIRSNNEIRNHIINNLNNENEFKNLENSINDGIKSLSINKSNSIPNYYKSSYLHHFGWINDMKLINSNSNSYNTNSIIASCSNDLSIKLWNYNNDQISVLGYHDDYIKKIGYNENFSDQLVSGGLDKIIKIWDINKQKSISNYKFKDFNNSIYSLDVNNNNLIICSGPSNIITLFDRRDLNKPIKNFLGHTDNVRSLILKDNSFLSGSSDTTIKLWDLRTTRILRNFEMHNSPVWSLYSPTYSNNDFTIFYSADKSGLLLKNDLRSSNLNSNSINDDYFKIKVNESLGISTIIANVNFNNKLNNENSDSTTNNTLFDSGINDIVETDDLGMIWTATSPNIHNFDTNFISSWTIPQTGKLVMYQGLILNKKLTSLSDDTNDNNNNNNATNDTTTDDIITNNLEKSTINDDYEDLVSQLSGDDLDQIDNALFSNSNGLDNILHEGNIDFNNNEKLSSMYLLGDDEESSIGVYDDRVNYDNDEDFGLATCFLNTLGNLNTQFLLSDDCFNEDESQTSQELDPFNNTKNSTNNNNIIQINRKIRLNNEDIDENDVFLLPYNFKPISTISGTSGLIKSKILNDKRHVAAMDQSGCVYIFDILQGIMIRRVDNNLSINSIETIDKNLRLIKHKENYNNEINEINEKSLNLMDRFEAVCEKFQTTESLPSWCSVQVKSGQLFITLQENNFTSCEIYNDEFNEYYDVNNKNNNNTNNNDNIFRVNLGKIIIKSIFRNCLENIINERHIKLGSDIGTVEEEVDSFQMNRNKNKSINVVDEKAEKAERTMKIPQPTPQIRDNDKEKEKEKKSRGLFGRLKGKESKREIERNNSDNNNNNKLENCLEKIQHIDNSEELIEYLSKNKNIFKILKTQEGYSERERDNKNMPVFEYNDSNILVVINEETGRESRPAYTVTIDKLSKDYGINHFEILKKLPIWITKGLLLHMYPIPSSMTNKIGFTLSPYIETDRESKLPKIDDNSNGTVGLKLNGVGSLRVSRICEFVNGKLPENVRSKELEIICRGKVLDEKDTLGTVKARVWRQGGDIELFYR